jgi:hypothetical protein
MTTSCRIRYEDDSVEIENADELFVALDLTPPEADGIILSQIGDKIFNLIRNDSEFLLILQKAFGTKGESKQPYLRCFGNNLSRVVTTGKTLSRALALLAEEEDQEYFLQALGTESLRHCITSVADIAESLEWLYGKEDELFLDLIGWDFIMRFIHSMETLGVVLKHLEKSDEGAGLEKIGWPRVLDCIQTPADLEHAFSGLIEENVHTLIEQLDAGKLRQLIPVKQELTRISRRYLSEGNASYLKERYDQLLGGGMH